MGEGSKFLDICRRILKMLTWGRGLSKIGKACRGLLCMALCFQITIDVLTHLTLWGTVIGVIFARLFANKFLVKIH